MSAMYAVNAFVPPAESVRTSTARSLVGIQLGQCQVQDRDVVGPGVRPRVARPHKRRRSRGRLPQHHHPRTGHRTRAFERYLTFGYAAIAFTSEVPSVAGNLSLRKAKNSSNDRHFRHFTPVSPHNFTKQQG